MTAPHGDPTLGLALGSGAARGWSHLGVMEVLAEAGIRPGVVCGSSIGALVGAAYARGHLQDLKDWVLDLERLDVVRLMDPGLIGGGFIQGDRLMEVFTRHVPDAAIEDLPVAYGCTATDLETGESVWIRSGSLADGVRASIALPGLFTPVRRNGRLLVDGGLTDPVPVALCRALGARRVIAVNINSDIVGRRASQRVASQTGESAGESLSRLVDRLHPGLGENLRTLINAYPGRDPSPGLMDVLAGAIHIMQYRITQDRLRADPPDLIINPHVPDIALMDFHRADEAMEVGRAAAERALREWR